MRDCLFTCLPVCLFDKFGASTFCFLCFRFVLVGLFSRFIPVVWFRICWNYQALPRETSRGKLPAEFHQKWFCLPFPCNFCSRDPIQIVPEEILKSCSHLKSSRGNTWFSVPCHKFQWKSRFLQSRSNQNCWNKNILAGNIAASSACTGSRNRINTYTERRYKYSYLWYQVRITSIWYDLFK